MHDRVRGFFLPLITHGEASSRTCLTLRRCRDFRRHPGHRGHRREASLNVHVTEGAPTRVGTWPVLTSSIGLFLLSTFVLGGILEWLPNPNAGHRTVLAISGAVAIAGWSLLAFRLIRGWALSEQRSRGAFEQAMAGIGLIDDAAQWIDVNERMAALTGYSVAELRGMALCELLLAEERDTHRTRLHDFLGDTRGPAEYSVESRWQRKDGSEIWLSRHIRRVPGVKGTRARAMMMVLDISDRKLAEQKALEQQSLESFQFVHSPMALIEWGPEMKVRRWSRQAEAIFGWTADEVVGRTLREAGVLPENESDHHENIMREFAAGARDTIESLRQVRCKNGKFAWCRWFSRAMRDADGQLQYFFSAGIDVTELREALETVQEKEGQLRAVFEQATVGVALLDEQGRWLSVNQRVCEITGYSNDELMKLDFQTITHPDDLQVDIELARQVAAGERRSYILEKRYFHKKGHIVWIRLHVGRIDRTAQTPMRYVSVIEDISERRRMEEEAAEHRRIREFHLENSPLGVIEWTPDLRVAYWSQRAEQMFGWKAAEVIGRHPDDFGFVDPADHSVMDRWNHQVQIERQDFSTSTHRNVHRDGRTVWCHWYNSILYAPDGSIRSVYCLVDDVTDEQSAIAQLKDGQAQLEGKVEERTRQLQETTRRWADRTRDLSVLAEMMSSLPAAKDVGEANRIVAGFLPRLFRQFSGEVWIEDGGKGRFVHLADWNLAHTGPSSIGADDCWAMRRGQTLQVEDPRDPLLCPHTPDMHGHQAPHVCTPIIALGEVIGLIHLRWDRTADLTPDRTLLQSTSEQIGLAIGNVRLREELHRQALRDPLTGLFNRRHFDDVLQRRFRAHQRGGEGFSLLMIDLDHFKSINDRLGHDAGDEVLRAVGAALLQASRSGESVFRLGGEEFTVLLDDPAGMYLRGTSERIRALIEKLPIFFRGSPLPGVTVSVGGAHCPSDATDVGSLIRRADQAMYDAKRTGRNRVCFAGTLSEQGRRLAVVENR